MTTFFHVFGALLFVVLLTTVPLSASAQQGDRPPAVPVEPIGAIIEVFKTHNIVALSDAHGNEQNHAFRLLLIRDPRFAATVNDVVIELGNARYQDVMDRYTRGEDVPYASLRRVWQDTTVPTAGNSYLMMQQLVEVVRALNASRPRERQLRILLGDPPIDWDQVRTGGEHRKWIEMRDTFPAALIQVEVLAKQRRALLCMAACIFREEICLAITTWKTGRHKALSACSKEACPSRFLRSGNRVWKTCRSTDFVAGSKSRDSPWDHTWCGRLHALLPTTGQSFYSQRREDRADSARGLAFTARGRSA